MRKTSFFILAGTGRPGATGMSYPGGRQGSARVGPAEPVPGGTRGGQRRPAAHRSARRAGGAATARSPSEER
ncbi:hypothetical protein JD77_00646 [Micromonospora olivasterospora]|uniref:Uncharacterized protein n=1 Tax=Micromonospora olivasterospora TaxID=1880 RepID=A0A562I4N2_MICOL|nr:hypothetical protein JD77_00646 [Micromonospora olivasterospora]